MVDWARRGITDKPPFTLVVEQEEEAARPRLIRGKLTQPAQRWACSCGAHGRGRSTMREVMADLRHHAALHKAGDVGALPAEASYASA